MKLVFVFFILLSSIFAEDNKTVEQEQTVLEKYMDFNTSYYTKQEYEKKFNKELRDTEALGNVTLVDMTFLEKNKKIEKKNYIRYKKIKLSKKYVNILDAIKDKNFIKYIQQRDKTAKLSLVISNSNRVIVEYPGGDDICIWLNKYLLILKENTIDIYEIGGFSAMYAPVPVFTPQE